MVALAQIFLSYARQDERKVEKLYQKLSNEGFKPWMDKKDILPGERWESSIQRAIRRSDFFLVCLSTNSVSKRGRIQKEIREALDIWQEQLDSDIYLIPAQLENCEVPENLRDFQWVNLFEEEGWIQLVKAIQVGMERRVRVTTDNKTSDASGPVAGTPSLQALLECLETKFSMPELRKVCFLLEVDWDGLVGSNKTVKAISLIEYAERRERLEQLWAAMQKVYPGLEC